MSPQSIILTYTGSLRMRLQSIYLTCTHTFFQLYKLSTQFAQANDRHIQNQYSLYIHVFPTLRTITQFAQAKDRHIQNKYSFCRHDFFQHYELSPYFAQAKDRHIQNKYNLYIHVFPTLRTITLVCLDQRQTHSKQVQPLYTRFSNSNNYHLSLPRPKIDTFKTSIDTFKTSIAFTHTFFQLYELSTQFAQAKDRHIQNKYSLYAHDFPTLRTITLVCLGQGQTHSKQVQPLHTLFFSNSMNYHLSLPRPRIDTFETSIAFTHTFFQLYELSPQFVQARDRHNQNKYSFYRHFFFFYFTNYHLSLSRPRIDTFRISIAFSGASLWNKFPLTVIFCHSLSSLNQKLRVHPESVTPDGLRQKTAREKDRHTERHF